MEDSVTAPGFDPASFDVNPYVRRADKPWGYELHWVRDGVPYIGKILHINKGSRLSLQIHEIKQESWFMMSGEAMVIWEDNTGTLIETKLQPGMGYSTRVGQKHRLVGLTDCDIIEVSTPEDGTTWRLEDDYARKNQTPEERASEYAQSARVLTDENQG